MPNTKTRTKKQDKTAKQGETKPEQIDTKKIAADSADVLTQGFWKDATAATDKYDFAIRRAAFHELQKTVSDAILKYWKQTKITR